MQAGLFQRLRRLALWMALGPFLMLSLISQGVMPTRGADGTVMLVLCTPDGIIEIAADAQTLQPLDDGPGSPARHPDPGTGDHCPWAGLQAPIDLTAAARMPQMLRPALPQGFAPVHTVLAANHATELPPATKPPFPV